MIWHLERWVCIIQIKKSYCSFPFQPEWCPAAILSWEIGRTWKRLCWDPLVFIVKALIKVLELWSEMGNGFGPGVESENCGKSSCWVCDHSVRIEIEISLYWFGHNIHTGVQAVFTEVMTQWCSFACSLVCETAVGERSSHMGVRSEKVWKVQVLWWSLCFCSPHSKVVQDMPEMISDESLFLLC